VTMKYEKAVAEARRLVSRSEEDQWRLAELTWQQVEGGKSRAQWAKDLGVPHTRAARWYRIWDGYVQKAGWSPATHTYTEAYDIVQGRAAQVEEHGTRSAAEARTAVRNMAPEHKAEIVREAIKSDPKVAVAASDALDERQADWQASRPVKADRAEETGRDQQIAAQMLLVKLRAAHRNLAEAASLSQNIRGAGEDEMRSEVLSEIEWVRSVCEVIEAGVNGGPLDSQLQALLDAEAGR